MTLQISRDLGHFTGGLLGKFMIYQLGFNDAFMVDNEYSVLVAKDHASVKQQGKKRLTKSILNKIATEVLGYKDFEIKKDGSCFYIFDKGYKKDDEA